MLDVQKTWYIDLFWRWQGIFFSQIPFEFFSTSLIKMCTRMVITKIAS